MSDRYYATPTSCSRRYGITTALLILVFTAASTAGAGATELLAFDIPEQPLAGALEAFSVATGVQVMVESRMVAGYQSVPVKGDLTVDAALQTLLSRTNLQIRYSHVRAVTLAPPASEVSEIPPLALPAPDLSLQTLTVRAGPGPSADLGAFVASVQVDIQKALRKSGAPPGYYRADVSLWIDSDRTIRHAVLAQSSGTPVQDRSVTSALVGLTLSRQSPPDLPHPLRLRIAMHQY